MAPRRDPLIDWLLEEIVFSGSDGISLSRLLALIDGFYNTVDEGTGRVPWMESRLANDEKPIIDQEFKANVWKSLAAHRDVTIGEDQVGNGLTLSKGGSLAALRTIQGCRPQEIDSSDAALSQSRPQENSFEAGGEDGPSSPSTQVREEMQNAPDIDEHVGSEQLDDEDIVDLIGVDDLGEIDNSPAGGTEGVVQSLISGPPNLFKEQLRIRVSLGLIWKTITGHGRDNVKVPKMEWKCLYEIAMTRSKGILQPDLLHLTGQNKHSLPRRTDSMARKGYIVKRYIHMLNRSKTSHLVLKRFKDRDISTGLPGLPDPSELPRDVLLRDLEPVPWHEQWSGTVIDAGLFGRTVVSVVRAWGTIIYSCLRMKMNVDDMEWHRKILQNTVRELRRQGILQKLSEDDTNDDGEISKISIKYLREPSPTDWLLIHRGPNARPENVRRELASPNGKTMQDDEQITSDDSSQEDEKTTMSEDAETTVPKRRKKNLATNQPPLPRPIERDMSLKQQRALQSPGITVDTSNTGNEIGDNSTEELFSQPPKPLQPSRRRRGRPPKAKMPIVPALQGDSTTPVAQESGAGEETSRALAKAELKRSNFEKQQLSLLKPTRTRGRPPKTIAYTSDAQQLLAEETFELMETAESTKPRERAAGYKRAIFTSHDELQREDGVPGAYRDIPELQQNRPGFKKQKMILFKSEKLKALPWMRGNIMESVTVSSLSQSADAALHLAAKNTQEILNDGNNETPMLKRKRPVEDEIVGQAGPRPKRMLVDVVRNLGASPQMSYKSPYSALLQRDVSAPLARSSSRTFDNGSKGAQDGPNDSISHRAQSRLAGSTGRSPVDTGQQPLPEIPTQNAVLNSSAQVLKANPFDLTTLTPIPSQIIQDQQLELAIQRAGAIELPENGYRLPVSKNGIAGNLVLSTKKEALSFIGAQPDQELPTLNFLISEMTQPPRTSIVGPDHVEIRITMRDQNGHDAEHNFRTLSTKAGIQETNSMRAKIFTAMLVLDIQPGDEIESPVHLSERPFKCEKCGGSWKNDLGLKYHLTRSKSSCNPDYVPAPKAPKVKRAVLSGRNLDGGPSHRSPELEIQQGKEIIMTLLEMNQRVFPGDKSLWFGIVAMALKKFPDSGLPFYRDCTAALELLIDTSQVREVQFSFKDGNGVMQLINIVTRNDQDPISPEVLNLKEEMKSIFPEQYLPSGFGIEKIVRTTLEERESLPEQDRRPLIPAHFLSGGLAIKTTRSGRTSRRPQRLQLLDDSMQWNDAFANNDEEATDSELDGNYADDNLKDKSKHRRISTSLNNEGVRRRRQSKGQSEKNDAPKARGGEKYLTSSYPIASSQLPVGEPQQETDSDAPRRRKTRKGISIQRTAAAASRPYMWFRAPAFLQNDTGAWSHSVLPPTSAPQKFGYKRLPEPITFMQTLYSSAWSFRPFGHGVRPIIARPSKRSDANPGGPKYRERLHSGFRPVVLPKYAAYGATTVPSNLFTEFLGRTKNSTPPVSRPPVKRGRRSSGLESNGESSDKRGQKPVRKHSSAAMPLSHGPRSRQTSTVICSESPRPYLPRHHAGASDLSYAYSTSLAPTTQEMDYLLINGSEIGGGVHQHEKMDSLQYSRRRKSNAARPSLSISPPVRASIHFLPPNTLLSDGMVELDFSFTPTFTRQRQADPSPRSRNSLPTVASGPQVGDDDEPYEIRWQEPEVLKQVDSGIWPDPHNDFSNGSYTVQGWFPIQKLSLSQAIVNGFQSVIDIQKRREVTDERVRDLDWAVFVSEVEGIERWETGNGWELLHLGTVAPDYLFLNQTPAVLSYVHESRQHQLLWHAKRSFTLDTLPYDRLESDRDEDEGIAIPPFQSLSPQYERAGSPKPEIKNVQYPLTTRRQIALPGDVEDILPYMVDHPDFAVEIAYDHHKNVPRRRPGKATISPEVENRLMVAVIVIRTLAGGLDRHIDWVLVSKLFPDFPMGFIVKQWFPILRKREDTIERVGREFQEIFLEAYKNDQIPSIDYDHLLNYDWDALVDFVLERVDLTVGQEATPLLPDTRERFNDMYAVKETETSKPWRDHFFSLTTPMYRRMELAASEQSTLPVVPNPIKIPGVDELTIGRSWARANTLTSEGVYDPTLAARKFATLGSGVLKAATAELMSSKVIMQRNKGRAIPGRGVEITEAFANSLRKHIDEIQLTQAAAFKASLDTRFQSGEHVTVEWTASDGDILAITNLQAHGRIKLEPTDVPMNRFGLTSGDYQTKRMDKARLRFGIDIIPTLSYVPDNDIPILHNLTPDIAPPRGPRGAIPIWYDIGDNLMPAMWKKVTCGLLGSIAMRPGIDVKEIVRLFTPAMEEWEVRLLVEWAVRVGGLVPLMEGYEGWNVAEWWWVIGGWA